MFLYRFEVIQDKRKVHVIVAADNDEQAFEQADIELESQSLKLPEVEDVILYEKRMIKKSAGYVVS